MNTIDLTYSVTKIFKAIANRYMQTAACESPLGPTNHPPRTKTLMGKTTQRKLSIVPGIVSLW